MAGEGTEIHRDTDEARGGSTPNIVRWILGISLLAAVVLLSAVWIFGAWSHDPNAEAGTASQRIMEDSTGDTDGTLYDDAQDQAAVGDDVELQDGLEVIENTPEGATGQ